jgi:hypothetical protein
MSICNATSFTGIALPDPCPDGVPCCDGYADVGPDHCTCWERVHDQIQKPPITDMEPSTRARMCGDCAFRPGSPERADSDHAVAGATELLACVHDPERSFWCHDGLRRIVALAHPNGLRVEIDAQGGVTPYDPPIVDGVPYRADGQPALHCAGLAAARRAKDWLP